MVDLGYFWLVILFCGLALCFGLSGVCLGVGVFCAFACCFVCVVCFCLYLAFGTLGLLWCLMCFADSSFLFVGSIFDCFVWVWFELLILVCD